MDALDVIKVCLRRWYVMVPILLVAAAAGVGLASQERPTFTANANYALVFRGTVTELRDPRTANPLGGNGGLLLGEALASDLMSESSQAQFGNGNSGVAPGEADLGTAYTISRPDDAVVAYTVQTWGPSAEGVRATVDAVLAAAPTRAAELQDRVGAPQRSHYSAFVTLPTQIKQLPSTGLVKMVIITTAVGLMAGAALSLLVERLAKSRSGTRPRTRPVVAWNLPDEVSAAAQAPVTEPQPAVRTPPVKPVESRPGATAVSAAVAPAARGVRQDGDALSPSAHAGARSSGGSAVEPPQAGSAGEKPSAATPAPVPADAAADAAAAPTPTAPTPTAQRERDQEAQAIALRREQARTRLEQYFSHSAEDPDSLRLHRAHEDFWKQDRPTLPPDDLPVANGDGRRAPTANGHGPEPVVPVTQSQPTGPSSGKGAAAESAEGRDEDPALDDVSSPQSTH